MSNYKKYGFCPFSKQLKESDCYTVCFCVECDTYFDGYKRGGADERTKVLEEFANAMIVLMPGHKQDILHIAEQLNSAK